MATSGLIGKLQIKPGQTVLLFQTPDDTAAALEPLPGPARLIEPSEAPADVVLLFVKNSAELNAVGPQALAAVKAGGALWVAYPKGSSGIETDLSRDAGWALLNHAGWQPVRQIAVDAVWSAVRFKVAVQTEGDPLDAHFNGAKATLRPIYMAVAAVIEKLGDDVEVGVRESYVAFRRHQQFAVTKMNARPPRVELGLRLPGYPPDLRLVEPGKSFGAESATVKVVLERPEEVDSQVKEWLAAAYRLG